jgi:NAD(P)H-hydrate repair Nnr-like enzyme with NAD(P)H-hydrate dehydratase domain
MSDYNTENFKRQGGAVWVIGGDLQMDGGKFLNATGAQEAAIANATGNAAATNQARINSMLTVMRNLGIIAT